MPKGQPFTRICQQLARPRTLGRADLHLHTTHSDGLYTPNQVVELACRAGLAAIAVTDHDTISALAPARLAARDQLEVIAGVELTTEYRGKELHLLAYLFDPEDNNLLEAMDQLAQARVQRYQAMIDRLRKCIPSLGDAPAMPIGTFGRRHLAQWLVDAGKAESLRQAFQRYLGDYGPCHVPKVRLPIERALPLVRSAGGVAVWAHPSYDCSADTLGELRRWGLGGVETDFPSCKPSRARQLRDLARQFGLAVTGGSDCHGPGQRFIGSHGVSDEELSQLRSATTLAA